MKVGKKKNKETNVFGETVGRVHLERQNIASATGRKMKALRDSEKTDKLEEKQLVEEELAREEKAENKRDFGWVEEEGGEGEKEKKSKAKKGRKK